MRMSDLAIRISNRTFEPCSGVGYRETGGSPVRVVPLHNADLGLYLKLEGEILDDKGAVIGCRIREREEGHLYKVFPGQVYKICSWPTVVDEDGDPECICIDHYVEMIPWTEGDPDAGR